MKNNKYYIDLVYDEKKILENIFTLQNPKSKDLLYAKMFKEERDLMVVRLVLKYILKVEKETPENTENLILKWAVLTMYHFYKHKYTYDVNVPEFDELLSKKFTLNDLKLTCIKNNELYGNVFNQDDDLKKNINNSINELQKHLENEQYQLITMSNDRTKRYIHPGRVSTLLKKCNNFFNLRYNDSEFLKSFGKNDNNYSFDRLIAEVLNNSNNNIINFQLRLNEDNFEKLCQMFNFTNLSGRSIAPAKSIIPLYFGNMVVNAIQRGNNDITSELSFPYEDNELANMIYLKYNFFINQRECLISEKKLNPKYLKLNLMNTKEKIIFELSLNESNSFKTYELSSEGLFEI